MIPSLVAWFRFPDAVYQRGWMIDSQLAGMGFLSFISISKGMDD